LPEITKTWLVSTNVVQKDNFLIKLRSWQLKGFNDNLIRYAGRIAPFIHDHRILLFYIPLCWDIKNAPSGESINHTFLGAIENRAAQ